MALSLGVLLKRFLLFCCFLFVGSQLFSIFFAILLDAYKLLGYCECLAALYSASEFIAGDFWKSVYYWGEE